MRTSEIVDLRSGAESVSTAVTTVIVDTACLTVLRMALVPGGSTAIHRAPGELTILCLEGSAVVTAGGLTHELSSGQLLYLGNREPHAIQALSRCVLLLTVARCDECNPPDLVDEASRESFPASDPPAYTP